MCTQSQLSIILKKIVQIYSAVYGTNLRKVILYGSYARGDFDSESDVDIAAIVQGERIALQEKLKKVWDITCDLELEYDTVLSPTVIPYDEYEKYRYDLPYYRNIAEGGIEIAVGKP